MSDAISKPNIKSRSRVLPSRAVPKKAGRKDRKTPEIRTGPGKWSVLTMAPATNMPAGQSLSGPAIPRPGKLASSVFELTGTETEAMSPDEVSALTTGSSHLLFQDAPQ